jgi:hypothetical protein
MDWVAIIGTGAGVLAVVVGLPPAIDLICDHARKSQQEILDALPNPAPRRIGVAGLQSDADDAAYIEENGLDVKSLEARLARPAKDIHEALRKLVKQHKVQIMIIRGTIDNDDHPNIRRGTEFALPIFLRAE